MWRNEFRIVYYSWEFDTLQSFYQEIIGLQQMYGWYTSPIDRGAKFPLGENRLELICRKPTIPVGQAGMRLETTDIEKFYSKLSTEPRVVFIENLHLTPEEYVFCIRDPVGNWIEVFQTIEDYNKNKKVCQKNARLEGKKLNGLHSKENDLPYWAKDDGSEILKDTFTAIIYSDNPTGLLCFYRDGMKMPMVKSWTSDCGRINYRLKAASGFLDIRQSTDKTPKGPALLTIEAEDIDGCFNELKARSDVTVLLGLTDTWYGDRIFQICDPEKNVTEILAYKRNLNHTRS